MSAYDPKRTWWLSLGAVQPDLESPFRRSQFLAVIPLWRWARALGQAMRRRDFIKAVASSAVACPLAGHAQSAVPVIGFLSSLSSDYGSYTAAAFRQGVTETGFTEGQSVKYEYRYANGDYGLLATMTDELVRRRVAIIAAGAPPAALAAKAATSTIPIVFVVGFDPIEGKLVESYNRPGGNATGVHLITSSLGQKRLELILQLVPKARTINMLVNPTFPDTGMEVADVQAAATANQRQLRTINASAVADIDKAFEVLADQHAEALMVASDPFFVTRRDQFAALAARYAIPAIYPFREFVAAGGLMSYGTSLAGAYREIGRYGGRILKGEKPADLPVIQPTTFEMVINLNSAKALALAVPSVLQARADEVIE
jgi:putative tryptophan/tyrosine transport system substrate-binding protein